MSGAAARYSVHEKTGEIIVDESDSVFSPRPRLIEPHELEEALRVVIAERDEAVEASIDAESECCPGCGL